MKNEYCGFGGWVWQVVEIMKNQSAWQRLLV
jgi:hypothetical protein